MVGVLSGLGFLIPNFQLGGLIGYLFWDEEEDFFFEDIIGKLVVITLGGDYLGSLISNIPVEGFVFRF